MYKIRKEFAFSAAHHLLGLPAEHPCSHQHGHNYIVIVELEAETLDRVGFVTDYRALQPVKDFIDNALDHKDLNDFFIEGNPEPINPTAENMAKYLYDLFKPQFPQLSAIEISETPKTTARYSPR